MADFGTAVNPLAVAHIVEQTLLGVDGVETCVDVAHQQHQGVVEVGGFLIFFRKVGDLQRIAVGLVSLVSVAGAEHQRANSEN